MKIHKYSFLIMFMWVFVFLNATLTLTKLGSTFAITQAVSVEYASVNGSTGKVLAYLTGAGVENITVTNNSGALNKLFTTNGNFTFEYQDSSGGTGAVTAYVNNIETCKNCFAKRYIWYSGNFSRYELGADPNYAKIIELIQRAKSTGYNGIVLDSVGSASYSKMVTGVYHPYFYKNLNSIIQIAQENGVELIPVGEHMQDYAIADPSMQEAFPVKNSNFLVSNGIAQPNSKEILSNGKFLTGTSQWGLLDKTLTFDASIGHNDSGSVKFAQTGTAGMSRLYSKLTNLEKNTAYRLGFWIKTQNYDEPIKVQIYDPSATSPIYMLGNLGWGTTNGDRNVKGNTLQKNQDWTYYNIDFNSLNYSGVTLYIGRWAKGSDNLGNLWIDDISIQKIGLAHTIIREGLPVVVQSENKEITYSSGVDYSIGKEQLYILSGSRIQNGMNLNVDWYQSSKYVASEYPFATACRDSFFDFNKAVDKKISELFKSKGHFMYIDEWRVANWDSNCGNITAGEYLKNTISKMQNDLLAIKQNYEIYIWNDMVDPYHNAVAKYWMTNGSMENTWLGLGGNINIMNWNLVSSGAQVNSLKFFSEKGYKQTIALYYDDPSLQNVKQWMQSLNDAEAQGVTGVNGFMYTGWYGNASLGDVEKVYEYIKTTYPQKIPTVISRDISLPE